jgi:hypothetical protein
MASRVGGCNHPVVDDRVRSVHRATSGMLVTVLVAATPVFAAPPVEIEVNRPRSIFECDTPVAEKWYGSTNRCLKELCAGENVISTHIIDGAGRLRRNPCYGRSPFELQQ